jgi:hypothetical protein
MSKKAAVFITVILLAGAVASGAIDQLQNTTIGLGSTIQLLQGRQTAETIQKLAVSNCQFSTRPWGTAAGQTLQANLAEIGHASGACASVGVTQNLGATGMQAQFVGGGCNPKVQGQTLGVLAGQQLAKAGGAGTGSGLQRIELHGAQYAANFAGAMGQSSTILGLQSSELSGGAYAGSTLDNRMIVTTTQSQAVH